MPARIKGTLPLTELTIPVADSQTALGQWQGIFLFEHRASPSRRELILTLVGELAGAYSGVASRVGTAKVSSRTSLSQILRLPPAVSRRSR